jgi:hypothetical protein
LISFSGEIQRWLTMARQLLCNKARQGRAVELPRCSIKEESAWVEGTGEAGRERQHTASVVRLRLIGKNRAGIGWQCLCPLTSSGKQRMTDVTAETVERRHEKAWRVWRWHLNG